MLFLYQTYREGRAKRLSHGEIQRDPYELRDDPVHLFLGAHHRHLHGGPRRHGPRRAGAAHHRLWVHLLFRGDGDAEVPELAHHFDE